MARTDNNNKMQLTTLEDYKAAQEAKNAPRVSLEELRENVMNQVNSSVPEIVREMALGVEIQAKILSRINNMLDANEVLVSIDSEGNRICKPLTDGHLKALSSAGRDASITLLQLRGLDVKTDPSNKSGSSIDRILKEIAAQTLENRGRGMVITSKSQEVALKCVQIDSDICSKNEQVPQKRDIDHEEIQKGEYDIYI